MPVEELTEAPASSGQGGSTADTGAEAVAPQPLDIGQYGNHVVTVKVDGEELTVPLSEAVAGYQRQSDYTRKTQGLAAQRAEIEFATRLANALENDPAGTLELLREHYTPAEIAEKAAEAGAASSTEPQLPPHVQQAVAWAQAQQQQQAVAEVDAILAEQQTMFGEEFNPTEVLGYALENFNPNVPFKVQMERAAAVVMFDKVFAKAKAVTDTATNAAAEEARIAEQKRGLVTHGGSSAGGSNVPSHGEVNSVKEAFKLAIQQHGSFD